MELTAHQEERITPLIQDLIEAKDMDITRDSIIELSGGAGVGKTFSILYIINYFKFLGWKIAITTPTHASLEVAKNIAKKYNKNESRDNGMIASTIHSFLKLKIENDYNTGKQVLRPNKDPGIKKMKCDLLIIDEKSMVGSELFEHVEDAIDAGRVKCVLLVGDKYQLPVVDGKMHELPESHSYELIEIVRQAADNPLIKLSLDLRKCIEMKKYPSIDKILARHTDIPMHKDLGQFLNVYASDSNAMISKTIGAFTNSVVQTYNSGIRKTMFPNKKYLEPGDTIVLQQSNVIDKGRQKEMIHSNGQSVELMGAFKNTKKIKGSTINYWRCVDGYNKSIDVIDPSSEQDFYAITQKVANDAKMAKGEFKKELWQEFFALKEEFIEIKYHYSSTLHKLQGASYSSVYLDIRDIQSMQGRNKEQDDLMFRLLYVGVTRSSDKLVLLTN